MRITGTRYTIDKKPNVLEMRHQGRVVAKFEYVGKTLNDLSDEIWEDLKRKGTTVLKGALKDELATLFPGIRVTGPLK
ncbi:MAG: hypothetical protein BAJATHORv1_30070 [Candidatus Thorarchaeota archaeon]|nr:MAG: hypothetical protein BAJATHORv1_30070 [Candidatus Thorarchaeota archaeon]